MSLRLISVLLGKEFINGPKSFMFIWAAVVPIVFTLVATLAFGTFFSEKPKLGIFDEGRSQLVANAQELDSVTTKVYDSLTMLKQATASGAVDMGIVLPDNLDDAVTQGEAMVIEGYIWGESLAKNRTIIPVTIADLVRELAGQEVPVDIESVTLGEEAGDPWNERLLPFLVLMGVFFSGLMLPSTSLIDEKQKKTLEAMVITPASIGDIFISKAILGIVLSTFLGIAILVLNNAFGAHSLLLVMVLFFGAIMAVELGLIFGALIKDITTLFTVWKSGGIFLFAPVFIYMFPQIPEEIAKIFPTYYALQPVVELSLQGGGWSDISTNFFILIGIDLLLVGVIMLVLKRSRQFRS
ncbi:ABC transporter permease [Chloroflexota bacterium]